MVVKDGPYRSWFSEGHFGSRGSYKNGRQVGPWKECDRFDRCRNTTYDLIYPHERERPEVRPEIPVIYLDGKYVFDFGSCWSTWVKKTGKSGAEDIHLNVGGDTPRCIISYIPQHVMETGGEGTYTCWVPFSVGKRTLDSLDLRKEFPRLGLPQFCPVLKPNAPSVTLVDKRFMDFAYTWDINCAALSSDAAGHDVLTITLEDLVGELGIELAAKQGPLIGRLCFNGDRPVTVTNSGLQPGFNIQLSSDPKVAAKEKKCAKQALQLKPSCP